MKVRALLKLCALLEFGLKTKLTGNVGESKVTVWFSLPEFCHCTKPPRLMVTLLGENWQFWSLGEEHCPSSPTVMKADLGKAGVPHANPLYSDGVAEQL